MLGCGIFYFTAIFTPSNQDNSVRDAAVRASIHQGFLWNWNCQLCGVSPDSFRSYCGKIGKITLKLLEGCNCHLDTNRWKNQIYILGGAIIEDVINRQLGKVSMAFVKSLRTQQAQGYEMVQVSFSARSLFKSSFRKLGVRTGERVVSCRIKLVKEVGIHCFLVPPYFKKTGKSCRDCAPAWDKCSLKKLCLR